MPKGNAYWERGKTKIQIKNLPLVSSSKEIVISVKSGGSSLTALNKTEDFGWFCMAWVWNDVAIFDLNTHSGQHKNVNSLRLGTIQGLYILIIINLKIKSEGKIWDLQYIVSVLYMYGRIDEKIHICEIVFVFFVSSLDATTNLKFVFINFFKFGRWNCSRVWWTS